MHLDVRHCPLLIDSVTSSNGDLSLDLSTLIVFGIAFARHFEFYTYYLQRGRCQCDVVPTRLRVVVVPLGGLSSLYLTRLDLSTMSMEVEPGTTK